MRINLFLLVFNLILGLILWVTLSGALAVLGFSLLGAFLLFTVFYADKAVLFFLGAREVRANDAPMFYQAAAQESYKLSVRIPALYFYDGALERAYILENRRSLSLVVSKQLLSSSTSQDLEAICFELLLQVKKGLAPKRTRLMFVIGLFSWFSHAMMGILLKFFRNRETAIAADLFLNYLLYPWLDLMFRVFLGKGYFRKLHSYLQEYPSEWESLTRTGMKMDKVHSLASVPSRKLLEYSSATRSHQFQNILALETLPHEWDYLFQGPLGAQ